MEEEMMITLEEYIETPAEKIAGHQAQIDQMERMIAENYRMISLGNDVVAREKMINTLNTMIEHEKAEIEACKNSLQ